MATLAQPEPGQPPPTSPEDAIRVFLVDFEIAAITGREFERSPRTAPKPYEAELVRFEDGVLQARFLIEEDYGGWYVGAASFCPSLILELGTREESY